MTVDSFARAHRAGRARRSRARRCGSSTASPRGGDTAYTNTWALGPPGARRDAALRLARDAPCRPARTRSSTGSPPASTARPRRCSRATAPPRASSPSTVSTSPAAGARRPGDRRGRAREPVGADACRVAAAIRPSARRRAGQSASLRSEPDQPEGSPLRERFDAGTGLVALGAVLLLVSLFIDWYDPSGDAWAVFESLDLAPRRRRRLRARSRWSRASAPAACGRALPVIAVARASLVVARAAHRPAAGRRATPTAPPARGSRSPRRRYGPRRDCSARRASR